MKTKNNLLILFSGLCLILLTGTAFAAEKTILPAFSDDLSGFNSQVYWVLLIFLIAVAVYVYFIWRDYEKDDDFLEKRY